MKIHSSLVLAGALSASLFCAENQTQANNEKAPDIIDAPVVMYAEHDMLAAMHEVVGEPETVNGCAGRSRQPESPSSVTAEPVRT